MTMRKLGDPILNDLMLLVQGRRVADLTPTAITRYVRHLDRIDAELTEARDDSGAPALEHGDDVVPVSARELARLREIAAMPLTPVVAQDTFAADLNQRATEELQAFGDRLLAEFGAELACTTAPSPTAAALDLLRAFKAQIATDVDAVAGVDVQASAKPTPPSPRSKK